MGMPDAEARDASIYGKQYAAVLKAQQPPKSEKVPQLTPQQQLAEQRTQDNTKEFLRLRVFNDPPADFAGFVNRLSKARDLGATIDLSKAASYYRAWIAGGSPKDSAGIEKVLGGAPAAGAAPAYSPGPNFYSQEQRVSQALPSAPVVENESPEFQKIKMVYDANKTKPGMTPEVLIESARNSGRVNISDAVAASWARRLRGR